MQEKTDLSVTEQILNQTFKDLIAEEEFDEVLINKLKELSGKKELGSIQKLQSALSFIKKNETDSN